MRISISTSIAGRAIVGAVIVASTACGASRSSPRDQVLTAPSYSSSKIAPYPKPGRCADDSTSTTGVFRLDRLSGCSDDAVRWARRVLDRP